MSDEPENKPDGDEQATATAAEGASPEKPAKVYTGPEVEAIVRDRLDRQKKALSKPEAQPAHKKEPQPTPGSADELVVRLAAMEAKAEVSEAIAELDWKPAKDDADMLRDAFKTGGRALFDKIAERIKPTATTEAKPVSDPANKYKSPGAPSGAPPEVLEGDATKWSKDYIDRLRSEGKLLSEVEKWRSSLPGGGGGLFRKRIPKVS